MPPRRSSWRISVLNFRVFIILRIISFCWRKRLSYRTFFSGRTVYFCISVIFSASLIKMYRFSKVCFGGSRVENGCTQVLIDYTSIDFGSSRVNTQLIDRSLILTVLWFWSSSVFAKCFRVFLITLWWLGRNYSSTSWFISQLLFFFIFGKSWMLLVQF